MSNIFTPDFYIDRNKEYDEISNGLLQNGAVFISGDAGVGKTVLAKLYAKRNPLGFSQIYYYEASQLTHYQTDTDASYLPFHTCDPRLIIIDAVDAFDCEGIGHRILEHFMDAVKFGHKVIATYRTHFLYFGNSFNAYELKLNGLSDPDAIRLIQSRSGSKNIKASSPENIRKILSAVQNNPLGIVASAELLRNTGLTIQEILAKIYDRLFYYDAIFETNSKLVLPENPEIETKVRIVNTSLIEKVKSNHKLIHSLVPRQFEELVAELFQKDGYNVSLTKQTHDGGKDLFIVENKRLGNFIYYVECKKFSPHIPVGVRLVRELYGTVIADRVTAGLLVTSSYFSKEAIQFSEQVKTQIALMEFIDLRKWILDLDKK
jgi:HJR/Mrr/RecB family endonuclease